MKISFEGIGQTVATFECAAALEKGVPVKLSDNGKVAACSADDLFVGITAGPTDGGAIAVVLRGYVKATYTGTAPTVATGAVCAAGSGKVKVASTGGRAVTVIDVNTTDKIVGLFI